MAIKENVKGKSSVKESDIERSKRILKEEQQAREKKCADEFKNLLDKHKCDLIITGNFSGPTIEYRLHFVTKIE
jgi:hypothetical protein